MSEDLEPIERDTCDRCHATTRLGDEREQPADDEPLYCDPCAQEIAGERGADLRAAYLEMAEECERRARGYNARIAAGMSDHVSTVTDGRAMEAERIAAWARQKAGE